MTSNPKRSLRDGDANLRSTLGKTYSKLRLFIKRLQIVNK